MHNISIQTLLAKLNSNSETGISDDYAKQLLIKNGKNALIEKKPPGIIVKFLSQFKDFMIIILIVAAVISYIISGHAVDSIVILSVVVLNAVMGVVQESKAEKSLAALKKMSAPNAKVIRNGNVSVIPSEDVVVGDIVNIDAGDLIPADGRIIDCGNLKVVESALTGESLPVEKHSDIINNENIPLGDRKNMVYSGTVATYGRATIVVTATGMSTENGKIAGALSAEKEELTPLQKRLAQIGTYLGFMAIAICAAIFGLGMLNNTPFTEIFLTAVTLAVAAVPEGLPAIVTIVLAMGVQRLVKRNAIVRKLPAVETLGSASVVCSDKTGTLTLNQMTVTDIYTDGKRFAFKDDKELAKKVLDYAVLCTDGTVVPNDDGTLKHIGDPTETGIVGALYNLGYEKKQLEEQNERIGEIPFDSDRKLMTTLHKNGDKIFSVTKGAPDELIALCDNANTNDILAANKQMADSALRVLAVAIRQYSEVPTDTTSKSLECNLSFIGLIGMIDPPRPEAAQAVAVCKQAGITPVMITGDHKDTASAIARQIGILHSDTHKVITGTELDEISDEQLCASIADYRVYARVSPSHKIRIVKAWKSQNQVVAMTGDGVNDAPALKAADIGCAMGITGTEVSKGAADMILTDDNFATIPAAIEEGRTIYQNIKKCISFLLSSNLGEVLTIFIAMLAGIGTPLLPTQILWVNLITDSLPALALGVEPVEKDIMKMPPMPANQGFFTKPFIVKIVFMGAMISSLTLLSYLMGLYWLPQTGTQIAQTMAFLTLALGQLFHAFNMKSDYSLFKTGIKNNKFLIYALLGGIVLQAVMYYVPFLANVFGITMLPTLNLVVVMLLAIAPLAIMEIAKPVFSKVFKN